MHRLAITYDLKRRGVALAGLAALTTFILGPWAALIAIGVLIATRNVTITWPAEQRASIDRDDSECVRHGCTDACPPSH